MNNLSNNSKGPGNRQLPSGERTDVFYNTPSQYYFHMRAECIASALYLLVMHLDMRNRLREIFETKSLTFIDHSTSLISQPLARNFFQSVIKDMLELQSLLAIARSTGSISQSNIGIIEGELKSLLRYLFENSDDVLRGDMENIDARLFEIEELPASLEEKDLKNHAITHIGPQSATPTRGEPRHMREKLTARARTSEDSAWATKSERRAESSGDKKNKRRAAILVLLKTRERISVRDVAEAISNVSEKTLQRELLAMVKEGILIKEGERRWSTYSLL